LSLPGCLLSAKSGLIHPSKMHRLFGHVVGAGELRASLMKSMI